ncbi:adenosylcobinamide-GDP ribazoletransferase [Novosphingobium olei]|uniref:Adenosylcobinamide-GDP ribazoletransferase n=1 Tax=Novosphingobium olei TaxID=2728851 RepID=A0A7Y0GBX3_9SPHN|nr:adenosylcobinamide-GDP ribazoletransferase [Novosphingobium olei]
MNGPLLAVRFLTRLPLPHSVPDEGDFARAFPWFPLAGLPVGLCLVAAFFVGSMVDPWVAACVGLASWIFFTGALHLDGLGDIADAAGASHADKSRLSQVLADPHIGSFGVVAIVQQCLAKLVLLHALAAPGVTLSAPALILVPMIARTAPLGWALALPPLHKGLGTLFGSAVRWRDIAAWAALLLSASVLVAPALLIAPVVAWGWGLWLRRRLGGISGDGHGAGIELVETALLLALVLAR